MNMLTVLCNLYYIRFDLWPGGGATRTKKGTMNCSTSFGLPSECSGVMMEEEEKNQTHPLITGFCTINGAADKVFVLVSKSL